MPNDEKQPERLHLAEELDDFDESIADAADAALPPGFYVGWQLAAEGKPLPDDASDGVMEGWWTFTIRKQQGTLP